MTSLKMGYLALTVVVASSWGGTWWSVSDSDDSYEPLKLAQVSSNKAKSPNFWLDTYAKSDLFDSSRAPLGEERQQAESVETLSKTVSASDELANQPPVDLKEWKLVAIIKEETATALIELSDESYVSLAEGDELPDGKVINKIGTRQIWLADKSTTALTPVELFRFR